MSEVCKTARHKKQQHFIIRMMERFAIVFKHSDFPDLMELIESYEAPPIMISEEDGKSFHPVVIQGVNVVVLYDWEFNTPLTAFYPNWFRQLPCGKWERTLNLKSKTISYNNRRVAIERKIKGFKHGY